MAEKKETHQPGWLQHMNSIKFYSKKLKTSGYISNMFEYEFNSDTSRNEIVTTYQDGYLEDRTIQPPNSKLFEYIVMMYYLDLFGVLNEDNLTPVTDDTASRFFGRKASLLPCLCGIQTTGYTDNNALFDMDFRTFKNLIREEEPVNLSNYDNNCLGVDIKIKGVNSIDGLPENIPIFDYADSIRAIDKLATILDSNDGKYFIQLLGFFQENHNTDEKYIQIHSEDIYQYRFDVNVAGRCLLNYRPGERNLDLWKQLLKNKFLFFNCKNEDFSTVPLMQQKFFRDNTSDSGLKILKKRLGGDNIEVSNVFGEIETELQRLHPDMDVIDLLKKGINDLNQILTDESPLICRSNSTQRNPQVRLDVNGIPQLVNNFPQNITIRLPKTKKQLGTSTTKKIRLLNEKTAKDTIVRYLKDEYPHTIQALRDEITTTAKRKMKTKDIYNAMVWKPFLSLLEDGRTISRESKHEVYLFNIPMLKKIKRLLQSKARLMKRSVTIGSLGELLASIRLRLGGTPADVARMRTSLPSHETPAASETKGGGQSGGGERENAIHLLKLLISTLIYDIDDLSCMDLKNYNLDDYSNHPIWTTINNLSFIINSVNNDNFQEFCIENMIQYWNKTEEDEFKSNILFPFVNIVDDYNKFIQNYNSEIINKDLIEMGKELRLTQGPVPPLSPILTPRGGRRKRTRKKRRKKKKSRRKRRK